MSLNDRIEYERSGDWILKHIYTPSGINNPATVDPYSPYRYFHITSEDGSILNDGVDKETITLKVVDGLEIVEGTDPAKATILTVDGEATLVVDGKKITKTLSAGSMSFDITTTKEDGSIFEIEALDLGSVPVEEDNIEIEVTN